MSCSRRNKIIIVVNSLFVSPPLIPLIERLDAMILQINDNKTYAISGETSQIHSLYKEKHPLKLQVIGQKFIILWFEL